MRVWRICREPHSAWDGEGGLHRPGRWHRRGVAAVYTSEHLSLAALEYFVNLDRDSEPADLVAVPAEIPGEVHKEYLRTSQLPANWRTYPAPENVQDLGMAWLEKQRTAVLVVPSVVIPRESNCILNPAHPEFRRIRVQTPVPFSLDPRMWK